MKNRVNEGLILQLVYNEHFGFRIYMKIVKLCMYDMVSQPFPAALPPASSLLLVSYTCDRLID